MNFSEWAFHDVEPIYLQLIQKIEYAILSKQLRSVYKELHADHETGAADNK